ncbi:hypothetical protein JHK87_042884 [Glycine soja]|nr:hypothetical protein JHK87_042884 [Glycine soja]
MNILRQKVGAGTEAGTNEAKAQATRKYKTLEQPLATKKVATTSSYSFSANKKPHSPTFPSSFLTFSKKSHSFALGRIGASSGGHGRCCDTFLQLKTVETNLSHSIRAFHLYKLISND